MRTLSGAFITQRLDEDDPVLGFTVGWVNALARRVAKVEVVCLARGRAALEGNVHVSVLPPGRLARYWRVRSVLRGLKRAGALDVVLAHMCPSYAVAAAAPWPFAPTFLWYAHSRVTRMLKLADRLCARTFSCSRESYPLSGRRLDVVGHGIDTGRFVPPPEPRRGEGLTLCSVGRITRSKCLDALLGALERFRERFPHLPVRCRIIGPTMNAEDEATLAMLRWQREHKGLSDVVQIEAPVAHRDIVGIYQQADVMANMTEKHSLDKATLEAMACGCLVLTRNDSFIPLLGPYAELMVRHEARSGALEGLIERLAALPSAERERISGKMREIIVRDHGLDRMMDRLVATMGAAVERRP
ncbi:MAG: glycosyltransferase family 4 protein [Verrucomicrobia bacterium]|nr:glycosyltransferase family 4 protein [Verrucomicrobiota bacterium]